MVNDINAQAAWMILCTHPATHAVLHYECWFHILIHNPSNMLLFLWSLKFPHKFFSLSIRIHINIEHNILLWARNIRGELYKNQTPEFTLQTTLPSGGASPKHPNSRDFNK